MKARKIPALVAAVGVLGLTACEGDSPTAPFCETVDSPATILLQSTTAGGGTVDQGVLRGPVQLQVLSATAGEGGVQNLQVRNIFSPAVGDTLFATGTAVLTPVSETELALTETLAVERGTGTFRTAEGQITAEGRLDRNLGRITGTFAGELCGLRD